MTLSVCFLGLFFEFVFWVCFFVSVSQLGEKIDYMLLFISQLEKELLENILTLIIKSHSYKILLEVIIYIVILGKGVIRNYHLYYLWGKSY